MATNISAGAASLDRMNLCFPNLQLQDDAGKHVSLKNVQVTLSQTVNNAVLQVFQGMIPTPIGLFECIANKSSFDYQKEHAIVQLTNKNISSTSLAQSPSQILAPGYKSFVTVLGRDIVTINIYRPSVPTERENKYSHVKPNLNKTQSL